MYESTTTPMFQKIALDIATAIYTGEFKEGEKIHGRSTLAGKYNVSPETIRRAIKILEDVDVVVSERGSGITILSKEKAFKYINKFRNIESVASYKTILANQIVKKNELENDILETIDRIIDYTSRLSNINPITPFEIAIPENSKLIGKSISELKFWQHTGATIVAVKSKDGLVLSPGPYFTFEIGDVLLVIGEDKVYNAVKLYLED
jgi:K+/H+ antiporter YhaU regulatory subunit KhtT